MLRLPLRCLHHTVSFLRLDDRQRAAATCRLLWSWFRVGAPSVASHTLDANCAARWGLIGRVHRDTVAYVATVDARGWRGAILQLGFAQVWKSDGDGKDGLLWDWAPRAVKLAPPALIDAFVLQRLLGPRSFDMYAPGIQASVGFDVTRGMPRTCWVKWVGMASCDAAVWSLKRLREYMVGAAQAFQAQNCRSDAKVAAALARYAGKAVATVDRLHTAPWVAHTKVVVSQFVNARGTAWTTFSITIDTTYGTRLILACAGAIPATHRHRQLYWCSTAAAAVPERPAVLDIVVA